MNIKKKQHSEYQSKRVKKIKEILVSRNINEIINWSFK